MTVEFSTPKGTSGYVQVILNGRKTGTIFPKDRTNCDATTYTLGNIELTMAEMQDILKKMKELDKLKKIKS